MSVEWCSAPEAGLPAPDVVVFLQLDATRAASRGGFGTERYERSEFQKIVRVHDVSCMGATAATAASRHVRRLMRDEPTA